jgi:choline-glycine betaine transporter
MLLVVTFFITSADSSTLALGMLTTGGQEHPSTVNRVIWGGLMGALASLLIVGGGIEALRSSAIITGGPFAIISVIAMAGIAWEFQDVRPILDESARREDETPARGVPTDDD